MEKSRAATGKPTSLDKQQLCGFLFLFFSQWMEAQHVWKTLVLISVLELV